MSKPATKSQPNNVVSLSEFRAKRAATEQWVSIYTEGSKALNLPPISEDTLKWLEQYRDL